MADVNVIAALEAVRDAIAGVRACALLMTGAQRHEVDQTAVLTMMAQTCERADHSIAVVLGSDEKNNKETSHG